MFLRVVQRGAEGAWLQRIQEDGQHTLHPHCQPADIRSVSNTLLTHSCLNGRPVNEGLLEANAKAAFATWTFAYTSAILDISVRRHLIDKTWQN